VIFWIGLEWVVVNTEDLVLAELDYFVLLFVDIVYCVVKVII